MSELLSCPSKGIVVRHTPSSRSAGPRPVRSWLNRVVATTLVAAGLSSGAWVLPAQAADRSTAGEVTTAEKRVLPSTSVSSAFPAGTLIVDMGVATQTVGNALKPYGFVYELLTTLKVPVSWAIANGKTARGAADFTATNLTDVGTGAAVASRTFTSSAFLVSGLFANEIPTSTLTTWTGRGVKIYRAKSDLGNLPQFTELRSWPKIVLDSTSSAVADDYYVNAGIPSTSYRTALPSTLTPCDDIFIFPHATPTWANHSNLRAFNNSGGYVFAQCHTPSQLENLDDPADAGTEPDLNFLSQAGMVPHTAHAAPAAPYSYESTWSDPIQQFMDAIDSATDYGLETVYLPKAPGWRPTTKVMAWDPDQSDLVKTNPISPGKGAISVYGRGFGNAANGMVMYQAGHSFTSASPTAAEIAAQRAFFNFNLLAGIDRGITATTNVPNAPIAGGAKVPITVNATGGSGVYSYEWTSSCGGTFANSTAQSTTFTAPTVLNATECTLRVTVTDSCGRVAFAASAIPIQQSADLQITKTDGSDPIRAGDAENYTISVSNVSTLFDAPSVVVTDTLDRNTTLVSTTPSTCTSALSGGSTVVTCALGTMPKGTSQTITIRTTSSLLTGSDSFAGSGAQPGSAGTICPTSDLCNKVAVTSSMFDPDTANNSYVQPTNVVKPGLVLTKNVTDSNDPDTIGSVGETLSYAFSVTNTGVLTLSNVKVTDSMLGLNAAACVTTLAPGATASCTLIGTKTYVVKSADVIAGQVVNNASASATPTLGADVVAAGTATMSTPSSPALKLVKTVVDSSDADTIASLGEQLTYAFAVTNTGNVPLTDVTITDDLVGLSGATCASTLAVGATTTCPGLVVPKYTTTALDVENGTVPNTATARASGPNATTASTTGSASIATETARTSISMTKRVSDASDNGIGALGEKLTYKFTVTNTGNVPLSAVTVSDAMLGLDKVACAPTLAVGETTSCPGLTVPSYTVKDSDIARGVVTNAASSTARTAKGTTLTATGAAEIPTPATPGLALDKVGTDASGDGTAQHGEKLTYTFTVTNTGNVPLTNVKVTDSLLGLDKATCVATLAVGATTTCPGLVVPAHTVGDADLAKGSVTNNASVTGTSAQGTTVSAADSVTFPAPANPAVSLAKSVKDASGNAIAEFGEKLTYTFTITNNGNMPLSNVTVSDAMLGLDKAACVASLPVGASTTCPLLTVPVHTVTDDDIDNQTIDNTATAAGTAGSGAGAVTVSDTRKVSLATEGDKPAITLVKKVADSRDPDAAAVLGEKLTYSFTVSNVGNVKVTRVRITDAKLGIDDAPCADVIKAGASVTCKVQGTAYAVDTDDVDKGAVTNTATASATTKKGKAVSDKSTVTIPVLRNPSLEVVKSVVDSPDQDEVGSLGEELTYSFRVSNTGDTTLRDVTLTDPLLGLDGAACVDVLKPGRSTQCPLIEDFGYIVQSGDVTFGRVDNTATTGATSPDGTVVRATDSASIQTPGLPGLRLDLQVADSSDFDEVGGLGETLTYTFTVTNTGNLPLTGVTVSDSRLGLQDVPCVATLAVGASATCTVTPRTTTVSSADIATGRVDETATATAKPPVGYEPVSSTAAASIATVGATPDIALLMAVADSGDPDAVGALGETLTYTFTVTNNGNVALTGVTITDTRLGLEDAPCVASLAAGATATCTITAAQGSTTVTAADLDRGKVVNTGTATATAPDGSKVSDDETVSIDTPATPRLEITKSASESDDADGVASLGEKVTYVFTVTNSGNVVVTDVTITDPKLGLDKAPCVASLAVGATTLCPLLTVPAYTTTAADVSHGSVDNDATASGRPSSGGTVQVRGSSTLPTQSVLPAVGLVVAVTDADGSGVAKVGEKLTYTFTVTNNGNLPLTNVTITDPRLGLQDAPCVANLAVGATTECPLLSVPAYTTTSGDQSAGKVVNAATVTGRPTTGGTVSADGEATIAVETTKPSVTLTMAVADSDDADTAASVDERLTYTYTVTNNGTQPLTNVRISDPDRFINDAVCTQDLAPGQSFTCTFEATHVTTGDEVVRGVVDNQATVKATTQGGSDVTGGASASIPTVNVGTPEQPSGGGGGFDYNWEYEGPTCDTFTVSYPADIPFGQANDVNIRFRKPDGSQFTLNFHKNEGYWSGNTSFDYRLHPQWPAGLTEWTAEWTQVAGTNYHWEGMRTCVLQPDGSALEKTSIERWDTVATTVRKGTAVANDAIVVRQAGMSPVLLEKLVGGVWTYVSTVTVGDNGGATVRFPVEDEKGQTAYRVRIAATETSTGFTTPVKQVNVN